MIDNIVVFVGYITLGIVASTALVTLLYIVWLKLSRSLFFFYIVMKADKVHPDKGVFKEGFNGSWFWRTRLLWYSLKQDLSGNMTISQECYHMRFDGLIPRGRVEEVKK